MINALRTTQIRHLALPETDGPVSYYDNSNGELTMNCGPFIGGGARRGDALLWPASAGLGQLCRCDDAAPR